MAFWKLEEARLVQEIVTASAVNDESVVIGYPGVPEGKCWIILSAFYSPSVAETQTVCFGKVTRAGQTMSLLNPISLALNPARATFIEQGMEYILFPKEYIVAYREDHTVGSTMNAGLQFVEIDLPLYTYEEPQEVKRQKFALSTIRRQLGGGGGRPGSMIGSVGRGTTGGRSGGAEPV